jgi:hypothetical protein
MILNGMMVTCGVSLIFSLFAFGMSLYICICYYTDKKSTHKVEFVPVDPFKKDDLNKLMEDEVNSVMDDLL